MKYNLLTKPLKDKEYIIIDFIATNLSKKDFEIVKKYNDFLKEYEFVPYKDTEFTWWNKTSKFLTKNKLYKNVGFDIDFNGNVKKF